ncbi:MAG: DUF4931 domain-containing protein [Candidatus Aminicenantes bacterium]|nr:DUF4931 domain-containing protein [Candidatus Aminicenantes bacterium]
MPELRFDPLQNQWVIIATERETRPSDLDYRAKYNHVTACPFCEGNESLTPPEIWAIRDPNTFLNSPGWKVRVVPNKFPALKIEATGRRIKTGFYEKVEGTGTHEVIIETPEHDVDLTDFTPEQTKLVLFTYQERLKELYKNPLFKYILIFKNHGKRAGASLAHSHSQVIAMPIIPRNVSLKLQVAKKHFQKKKHCLICELIQQERKNKVRVISLDGRFIAWTPFASRFPFEIFIAPIKHNHRFEEIGNNDLESLSKFLKDVLLRLKSVLNDPPYNFILNTSQNLKACSKSSKDKLPAIKYYYHWHIEIIPRLTRIAGFEWGSGIYINPCVPEAAAKYLRDVKIV